MQDQCMNAPKLLQGIGENSPMHIHVSCECRRERFSWGRFFGKVFLTISAFMLASFVPLIVLVGLFVLMMIGVVAVGDAAPTTSATSLETEFVFGRESSNQKLLEIPIQGIILGERSGGSDFASFLYGGITYGADVRDYLRKASQDSSIKGVVLAINSPGGTVHGSAMIGDAIREYTRRTNRPVYAHITGLGASGAYWSAVSAQKVFADQGSLTGSIGVIMGSILYYDEPVSIGDSFGVTVDTTGGIEEYGLSAGRGKDFSNPFRRPTEEELSVYRGSLDRVYDDFVRVVSDGRGISTELIRNQIGAFVYDNAKAQEYRLIDGTQYAEVTYQALATEAGVVGDDFQVVRVGDLGLFAKLFAKSRELILSEKRDFSSMIRASGLCVPKSVSVYYGDLRALCR